MSAQDTLNERYKDLATRLGDLYYRKQAIELDIDRIKAEIKAVDQMAPFVLKMERELTPAPDTNQKPVKAAE